MGDGFKSRVTSRKYILSYIVPYSLLTFLPCIQPVPHLDHRITLVRGQIKKSFLSYIHYNYVIIYVYYLYIKEKQKKRFMFVRCMYNFLENE